MQPLKALKSIDITWFGSSKLSNEDFSKAERSIIRSLELGENSTLLNLWVFWKALEEITSIKSGIFAYTMSRTAHSRMSNSSFSKDDFLMQH